MDALGETEELEVFDCPAIIDLIDYKWKSYAGIIHYIGLIAHLIYVSVFSLYVFELYIYKTTKGISLLEATMLMCILYPLIYDMTQLKKQGFKEYLSDPWNYLD